MMRSLLLTLLMLSVLSPAVAQSRSVRLALADLQQIDSGDRDRVAYLTTELSPADEQDDLRLALKLMVCHATQQPEPTLSVPQEIVPGLLYRVDLGLLGWLNQFDTVAASDPYRIDGLRLHRADWFVDDVADASLSETQSYYRLLLGFVPRNERQWVDAVGVDNNYRLGSVPESYGLITRDSGVSVNKSARWIESIRASGNRYAYVTRDFERTDTANDPLDAADGQFRNDNGREHIDEGFNGAQWYFLSSGAGQRVDKAPASLVKGPDVHQGTEIKTPISCMICHAGGLLPAKTNEVLRLAQVGVFANQKLDQIAGFHLRVDFNEAIKAESARNQAAVRLMVGGDPKAASAALVRVLNRYQKPLSIADVARELELTTGILRQLIATRGGELVQFAGLLNEGTISRDAFEQAYPAAKTQVAQLLGAF